MNDPNHRPNRTRLTRRLVDIREAQNAWGAEIQRMVGGAFDALYDGTVAGSSPVLNPILPITGDNVAV